MQKIHLVGKLATVAWIVSTSACVADVSEIEDVEVKQVGNKSWPDDVTAATHVCSAHTSGLKSASAALGGVISPGVAYQVLPSSAAAFPTYGQTSCWYAFNLVRDANQCVGTTALCGSLQICRRGLGINVYHGRQGSGIILFEKVNQTCQ